MTYLKPAFVAAAALSLSACMPGTTTTTVTAPGTDPVVVVEGPELAPRAPEPVAGVPGADSLDGTWNLVASQCGDPASQGSLVIAGTNFNFPTAECTVGTSSVETNFTRVSLGCKGAENRQLDISIRPGVMRMTEGSTTLTYFRCS